MKVSSRLFWVLGVVLVALAIPFSAQAGDGQIKIGQTSSTTFPVILDKPGSYVLTSNLEVTTSGAAGVLILVNDVTLDLNGFAIIGDKGGGTESRGIDARGRRNITIKNGTVRNFLSDGVAVHELGAAPENQDQNSIIEKLKVSDNGFAGIVASYALVRDCVAADNSWTGIVVNSGTMPM